MTGTDEARRLLREITITKDGRGYEIGLNADNNDDWIERRDVWLAANPEGKPAAKVTEAQVAKAIAVWEQGHKLLSVHAWMPRALRAALASAVPAAPETIPGQWPAEITPSLQEMLGLMLWNTTPLAHAFRLAGRDIPPKTELEQAFVFHWLVGLYLKHGDDWRRFAGDELKALPPAAPAVSQPPADTRETGNG